MFTGLVTDIGRVIAVEKKDDAMSAKIATSYEVDTLGIGRSICCAGVCLTVVEKGALEKESWFSVDISKETLSCTTLGDWQEGTYINLERSLQTGDEMGGHVVTGHVDHVVTIKAKEPAGDSIQFTIEVPQVVRKYVAKKGSITLDGVSLTVNDVTKDSFDVNIIPHTLEQTTFQYREAGDQMHLEVDIFARYVGNYLDQKSA